MKGEWIRVDEWEPQSPALILKSNNIGDEKFINTNFNGALGSNKRQSSTLML